MWLGWLLRLFVLAVTAFVLYGLAPVIVSQWQGTAPCPRLGPIPACYVVGGCYLSMAVASIAGPRRSFWLFLVGWLPVFLLALVGSTLELFGRETCPASPGSTPLCYYSLAVASILLYPAHPISRYFLCVMTRKLSCLLYTSPSPRDQRGSRMPSSA